MRRCGAELLDIRTYDEVQRHEILIALAKCAPLHDERLSEKIRKKLPFSSGNKSLMSLQCRACSVSVENLFCKFSRFQKIARFDDYY